MHRHRRDAGVGEHDVDAAEEGDSVVERRLQRCAVAHVGLHGVDASVERLDLRDGLGKLLRRGQRIGDRVDLRGDVDRDDVCAFLGQTDGVRASLPARGSGDEGDFAFEDSHVCSFD